MLTKMDPQTFMDIANVVTKLKMYPYFDICNYILMCMMVRDDNHPGTAGTQLFSRKHPLACWVASMMMCFAGGFLANALIGEPVLAVFKDHQAVITATIVWYLLNYSPFDLVYKICRFLPFKIVIYCMKEVLRANKIHHAVLFGMKTFPNAYLLICMIGVIKGSGSGFMRFFARGVTGQWNPSANRFLHPTFVTKGSLAATLIFLCERKGLIDAPHSVIYFGVVLFFIYFRLSSILLGIHDPFVPFENLFCAIFMGGMWDALKRALTREKKPEGDANSTSNDLHAKSKEDKKRD